ATTTPCVFQKATKLSAAYATSRTPLALLSFWNGACQPGRRNSVLKPPPLAPPALVVVGSLFHAVSAMYPPPAPATKCVPPTAVTRGSDAGVDALKTRLCPSHDCRPAPLSPDDAKIVMPSSVAFWKTACCCSSTAGAAHISASPKLCVMMSPRLLSTAYLVAVTRWTFCSLFASATTIDASGAIAWTNSTSTDCSSENG